MRYSVKTLWIVVVIVLSLSFWGLMRAAPVSAGIPTTPTPTSTGTLTPTPTNTPTPVSSGTPLPLPTDTPAPTPTSVGEPTLTPIDSPATQGPGPQPSPTPAGTPTPFPLLPETGDTPSAAPLVLGLGGLLLLAFGSVYLVRRRVAWVRAPQATYRDNDSL